MGGRIGELADIAANKQLKRGASAVRAILRAALDLALPPGMLVKTVVHHAALLRAARRPVRL